MISAAAECVPRTDRDPDQYEHMDARRLTYGVSGGSGNASRGDVGCGGGGARAGRAREAIAGAESRGGRATSDDKFLIPHLTPFPTSRLPASPNHPNQQQTNMPGEHSEKRERYIRFCWQRDPTGPILRPDRAPPGLRTPNGLVWGHKVDDIFWIERIPGVNVLTIWSRSMIKEHGEGYDDAEWDEPLVEPRVLRPWPVLKVLNHADDVPGTPSPLLNPPDHGCAIEHLKKIVPREGWVRAPDSVAVSPVMLALLGQCPYDPEGK